MEHEARALAVELANEECQVRFSQAPFLSISYGIEFREGRWQWGDLDPYGVHGFSAQVSFDKHGADATVAVYYSADNVTPIFR